MLHHPATTTQTVRTNRTRTLAVSHVVTNVEQAAWASQEGRMEELTESNIDEILFPADWAFSRMLSAHLS